MDNNSLSEVTLNAILCCDHYVICVVFIILITEKYFELDYEVISS